MSHHPNTTPEARAHHRKMMARLTTEPPAVTEADRIEKRERDRRAMAAQRLRQVSG